MPRHIVIISKLREFEYKPELIRHMVVLAVGFKLVSPIKNLLAFDFSQFPVYATSVNI